MVCVPVGTAFVVQEALGAKRAGAFDLGAVCAGFSYALHVAAQMVRDRRGPSLVAQILEIPVTDFTAAGSLDFPDEGIHFDLGYVPLKHLGYKAIVVNLSDVYAMNAAPR